VRHCHQAMVRRQAGALARVRRAAKSAACPDSLAAAILEIRHIDAF